jgi:hypothetical protein
MAGFSHGQYRAGNQHDSTILNRESKHKHGRRPKASYLKKTPGAILGT